jgi:predicted NBD/HSP70 family sugar kinase
VGETVNDSADLSDVLAVLRDGVPRTKSELAKITGRARSTVSSRLEELVARGLVERLDQTISTKGRPSALYALGKERRLIAAIDLGARHGVLAVTDLTGRVLTDRNMDLDIAEGPITILDLAIKIITELISELGRTADDLIGVGIGLPGPVEYETGLPTSPPIMPGWDRFDVKAHIRETFDVPVIVDNDVNVMAVGEFVIDPADETEFLMVKVATGIGAGVIAGGRLVRGRDGAAGDIGHIQVKTDEARMCRCGQMGCCEAFASGTGVAQTLSAMGISAASAVDAVNLVRGGDIEATRVVREAGRTLGGVLASCISMLNPGRIVIGGEMALVGEPLLAGIREVIYQRSQPLATKHLQITTASNNEFAGVIGASRLVQDVVFGMV